MKTAVVTAVHHRTAHLRRQLRGLHRSESPPDLHIIVAIDDDVSTVLRETTRETLALAVSAAGGALPIAAARNVGAHAAITAGAELLVFLDVDCIPSPALIPRYQQVAAHPDHRGALLCGPVTYLPPPGPSGYPTDLTGFTDPHPARPAPPDDEVVDGADYHLFWSLSFGLTTYTWQRIGGFCTDYRGYGGEDTDFAQTAGAAGIPLRWIGGAHAFHQFHPVSDPPVEHLRDIVRNAEIFHRRWGWWPMSGWLDAFHRRGLIVRSSSGRPIIC